MHVAILHNLDHDLLEEDPGREARKDVTKVAEALASALDHGATRAELVPVSGVVDLVSTLEGTRPDLVVNLCESLAADSRGEMAIPLLLDLLRIPYSGSPALALGLALHKHKAKEVLRARGVPTPAFLLAERLADLDGLEGFPFPLIVKPSREDASVGVDFDSVVTTRAQLERAVRAVLVRFRQPALVEQYVDGPEIYVPLLGNRGGPRAHLPLTEIRFGAAFAGRPRVLSYRAKWETDSAECKDSPAVACTLGTREQERLRALATAAFDALECQDYGRIDLRLDADGAPYVIDVNPNCDLHPEAGFARAAEAAGITYRALASRLVEIALERSHGNTPTRRAGSAIARRLLSRIETFSQEEVTCALELIDLALQPSNRDYFVLVAVREDKLVGYVCYGPTPMTDGTCDLYWIASDPKVRGQGVGAALVSAMEGDLRRKKARLLRVETSAMEAYGPTRGFYQAMRYVEEARFRDFYKVGEDLIILSKKL